MTKALKVLGFSALLIMAFTTNVSAQVLYRPLPVRAYFLYSPFALATSCCVLLCRFLFNLIIGVLVYNDAVKHKVNNALAWGFIAGLAPLIGLLIYYFTARSDALKSNTSTSQSTQISDQAPVTEIDTVEQKPEPTKKTRKKKKQ